MSRPKRYETNAQKQAAYRLRKKFAKPATVFTHGTDVERPMSTIDALRALVKEEEEKPSTEVPVNPVGGIYRNDAGGVISKFAWEKLQEAKRKAKDGGYEIDDYSQ